MGSRVVIAPFSCYHHFTACCPRQVHQLPVSLSYINYRKAQVTKEEANVR
jgi:hypothetical protein